MTEVNSKHPNYDDNLLPPNNDIFKPEFKRDSRGRYFMQLPGYGKWMVGNEPGSKIISQGSEDEAGGPGTDPGSLRTGSLHVNTVITVGDNIEINAPNGCIYVGDYSVEGGTYLGLCGYGIQGITNKKPVFAFLLKEQTWEWRTGEKAGKGDALFGSVDDGQFVYWNNDESKLYIFGDLVIAGDIVSANYPSAPYYWLDYDTGDIEITGELRASNVDITGGDIDNIILTGLLAGSEPSIQGWSHDMDFTASNWQTINWTSGTIYLTDGTTYSVNSGSLTMTTGDPYYIYYNGSSTLATTTNPSTAVGSGKILICVAKRLDPADPDFDPNKLAQFQVFGNEGQGIFITADDIAANTITANEIFANTITTNEIAANTIVGNNIASLNIYGKNLQADQGDIAGWIISSQCFTKDKDIGVAGESRIQMCIGPGTSAGHIQAAYNHNRLVYPGFPHPNAPIDLVQITQGDATDPSGQPEPRMDIYRATASNQSKKRMMLNAFGLHFYDENETLVGTVTGNDAGTYTDFQINDMRVASDTVRIFSNGIRISYNQPLNAADGLGKYFQFYCKSETYGVSGTLSAPTNNIIRIENDGGGAIAHFSGVPGGNWALNLYGNLALYTNTFDQGNYTGAMYFNTTSQQIRIRTSSGWQDVGGAGLPSGGSYDMMRCISGTTWEATDKLWVGGSSTNQVFMSGADMTFEIASYGDYAFKRGSSYRFVIDSNIWAAGELFLGSSAQLNIRWTGSQCYINKQTYIYGSIYTSGNVYVASRAHYSFWSATLGAYVLASGSVS